MRAFDAGKIDLGHISGTAAVTARESDEPQSWSVWPWRKGLAAVATDVGAKVEEESSSMDT